MAGDTHWETYLDRETGIRFLFKTDADDPDVLHIYARHLTTPEDAIQTFFAAPPQWNERYRREQTYSDTHGLYWNWVRVDEVVRVITCFALED